MKNNPTPIISYQKIIEVINSETKKVQPKRKTSAQHHDHNHLDHFHPLLENHKEKITQRPHQHLGSNEDHAKASSEQPQGRDNKNIMKLPMINGKKIGKNGQKQNDLSEGEFNFCVVEGRRANIEHSCADGKQKGCSSIDNVVGKLLNVKMIKEEKISLKHPQSSIKSMKSVRHKQELKLQHQKQCSEYNTDNQRKPHTVNRKQKRQHSWLRPAEENILKKQRKELKLGSTSSQTVNVMGKKKYSINYLDFCLFVSLLNEFHGLPSSNATYKAFVGKGNNSILIKNTLKARFWWNISQNDAEANLNWQQSRDNKLIQSLRPNSQKKQIKEERFRFWLQKPEEGKEGEKGLVRQFTKVGLHRLMSEQQQKKYSKNAYVADLRLDKAYHFNEPANKFRIHNHFEFNWNITNKKALYYNLKKFYQVTKKDPFQYIPLTFHVQIEGDNEWTRFLQYFNEKQSTLSAKGEGKIMKKKKEKNLWIIKPGENSNQGCGIQVAENIEQIKEIILKSKQNADSSRKRSHIIQRYLMPLLYNKRKFDIRCYILVTSFHGNIKAYWYEEGYIRTSSKQFTLKNLKNRFVHLTNDAVQKKSEDYGKYENGNKVSFSDFEKYIQTVYADHKNRFHSNVYPKMMQLAADSIRSVHTLINPHQRQHTFEIFGLDFMIDEDFNTWLIEVNNNPCLELGCPLLARLIPNMIENAFKIAIDPLFPPPKDYPRSKSMPTQLFQSNKFSLIFDSKEEQQLLRQFVGELDAKNLSNIVESDEEEDNHEQEER